MGTPFGPVALPLTGCITLLVSAIFIVLSFVAPSWSSHDGQDSGLWKRGVCDDDCWYVDQHHSNAPGWINAVRALLSISIIIQAILLVCIPVYLYVSVGLYYRIAMICASVASIVAAILTFIGVIVYGAKSAQLGWKPLWCFVVAIIGGIILTFAAVIFIVCVFVKKPNFREYYESKAVKYQEPQHIPVFNVHENPDYYVRY